MRRTLVLGYECLAWVLDGELQIINASAFEPLHEGKFVANIDKWCWVMLEALVIVGNCKLGNLGMGPTLERLGYHSFEEGVRNEADNDANGDGQETKENSGSPHEAGLLIAEDVECFATKADDDNLPGAHDDADTDEEPVSEKAFKNVELIIQAPVAAYSVSTCDWSIVLE